MSKSHSASETKTRSRSSEKANKPADKAATSPSGRSSRADTKKTTDNKNKPFGKKSPDVTASKSPDRVASNDVTANQSTTAKNSKSSGNVKTQASPATNMFIEEGTAASPSGKTRSSPQHQANKTTSRFDGLYVSDDGFLRAAVDPLGHVIESCPRLTLRINELMDQAVDIDSDLGFSKKRLLPDYYYTSTVPTGGAEGESDEEGGDEAGGGKSGGKGKGKKKKKGGANAVKVDINPGCFAKAPSVFQVIYVPPALPLSELKMVDFMPADAVVHAA